jgi:hypothetical protein
MAFGMYFTPSSFTPERYDEVNSRLEAIGARTPPGRLYHFALEVDGLIQVFDIWESADSFHAFGATLVPVFAELSRRCCLFTTALWDKGLSPPKTTPGPPGVGYRAPGP